MKIKIKQSFSRDVVESFDEATDTPDYHNEFFKEGEVFEGDIVDDYGEGVVDFQFGDGSMIFSLNKSLYEVIEE